MARVELILPHMGESIEEAVILNWVKKVGEKISMDDTVVEVATDKVDSEVPSPVSGTILEILFEEGDTVKVGKPIAIIKAIGDVSEEEYSSHKSSASTSAKSFSPSESSPEAIEQKTTPVFTGGGRFYSPLIRNIAKQEDISAAELDAISATGKNNRLTKSDILNHLSSKRYGASNKNKKKNTSIDISYTDPSYPINPGDEIVEMDRMRKIIANHMVQSKRTAPHVSSFVEADVTNVVTWRKANKDQFQNTYSEKLTYTPIFLEAISKAVEDFPMINVSVDGDKIIVKKNINVGMATALPSGNLIVPVIKNTNQMSLASLAGRVNDLASRAREAKLRPDEIQGGTLTVSNIGTFNNIFGVPIINQPQVAILALGAIKKKPAVLETPEGDVIAIRHLMYLSMSYDHRVVDGILGGSFLARVAEYLECFDINRKI